MDLLRTQRYEVVSHGPAAAYTGWLLRQYGAQVDHTTALDPESLGAFLGEGATFSTAPHPRKAACPLIGDALPGTAAGRALEAEAARRAVTWISPWGASNPWAGRPATALTLHAAGGWLKAVGEPDREPVGPPGPFGQLVAGLYGAIATVAPAALENFPQPGARPVEVSVAEAIQATDIYDVVAFQYHGTTRKRAGNRYSAMLPLLSTLPCRDGHIGLHIALHRQWLRLCELIGHPSLPSDARFADPLERAKNYEALYGEFLLPWLATKTREEAYRLLQAVGIPSASLPDMSEVLASQHLAARGAFRAVTTPAGRRLRVPGPPSRLVATGASGPRPAAEGPWRPGRLRVVDMAMGWAGPLVSHILACFGADVIKIEGADHFDWWRGSRPPGDDPGLALHERSHVFNTVNRGKRGITLDITTAEGAAAARQLAATADVVIENFSAGVVERLGLTYEELSAGNPGLIMLRQPGFGSTGPDAGNRVFGNTIEGMSGLTSLMGYEGGQPLMMSNAAGDPVSGLNGTLAVLAALVARRADGRGRCLEAAQLEGFLPFVSAGLIEYQVTGQVPPRRGNQRPGSEPSGVFPAAGEDRWVAIEVPGDEEWRRFAAVVEPAWLGNPVLASAEGRRGARVAIHAGIAAWTAARSREEAVEPLAAAGVPAAPVHDEADILGVDLFGATGFFVPEERAVVGLHLYPGLPLTIGGERLDPGCPAPLLGEHNAEVFAALAREAATPA